jgi:hypothetical protein
MPCAPVANRCEHSHATKLTSAISNVRAPCCLTKAAAANASRKMAGLKSSGAQDRLGSCRPGVLFLDPDAAAALTQWRAISKVGQRLPRCSQLRQLPHSGVVAFGDSKTPRQTCRLSHVMISGLPTGANFMNVPCQGGSRLHSVE